MAGRKQGVYSQATRIIRLLEVLTSRGQGAALASLAEELGVSERQMRRDLAALRQAGYLIEDATIDGKIGVRLKEKRAGSVTLTLRERYTLLAMRRVFSVLEGTPFHEDIESIYAKVSASLGDRGKAEADRLMDCFAYLPDGGTKAYEGKEEVLDALLTGVIRRFRVEYTYKGANGRAREGLLEPYAVVLYKHGLYVIGRPVPEDGTESTKTYVYAVERFTSAEHVRGANFQIPAEFVIDRHLEGAFGIYLGGSPQHVVLEFEARAVPYVEARAWHRTQKITRLPAGRARLELDVADLTQLAQWVVGWGPLVRVISPEGLAVRVRTEHEDAAARYA
ncbi:MAG: WYL domain-containing protein [Deltaproteobacteria bacterium]|nr:WYL domain-containing protein [Deltaproteobacteria bacterium]